MLLAKKKHPSHFWGEGEQDKAPGEASLKLSSQLITGKGKPQDCGWHVGVEGRWSRGNGEKACSVFSYVGKEFSVRKYYLWQEGEEF